MKYSKKLKNHSFVESTMPITTKIYHFQKLRILGNQLHGAKGPSLEVWGFSSWASLCPGCLWLASWGRRARISRNHQVEAIELELDRVLSVFPGLQHLSQEGLDVPVEFGYPPISSVPTPSVANVRDPMDSVLSYLYVSSHLIFLTNFVFFFI